MPRLPPLPDLSWTAEGAPRAGGFDDVYFSRAGGLAESEAVFLAGCGLPDAWRGRERFAICELGFGTGLNVLAAWRAWKRVRTPHAILHISSLEAYPLARPDAEKALSNFPEVAPLAAKLLGQWPVRTYAPQRFWFPDDGFALTLHVGDAAAILSRLEARFDAWFLDGFAPSRNPDMWSAEVLAQVARLSAPKARLATFTVAGGVRRALADVGFAVEKKQGFGAKRERLEAQFLGPVSPISGGRPYPFVATAPKRVAVLGAGIAGASCAQALVRRGVETLVIEGARSAATGASGNPAGLVMPRLDRGPLSELFLAAFLDAVKTYELLGVFDPCGVEERAQQRAQAALADMIEDPPLPGDWFEALGGVKVLHRRAGLVRPGAAVAAMLRDASLMCETSVEVLEGTGDGWILRANGGRAIMKADAVVLACGAALARFEPASFLPIELSRGQIEWGRGAQPEHAITQGSYVAPFDGGLLFGATFDAIESGIEAKTDAESRRRNLAALETIAPELAASVDVGALQSRAAVRATTSDRAPIAGSAPDAAAWLATFAEIKHGRTPEIAPPAHSGVYIFGGLGARGLTLAPLLGERIASEMFAEPHVLSRPVLDAIHPARFLYRRLRRGTA